MPEPQPGATWPVTLAGIGDEAAPDLAGQLAAVRPLGGLELRSIDGIPLAELTPARLATVAAAVRAAGLPVVCLDSRIGNWGRPVTAPVEADLAELDTLAGYGVELGCRFVRVMSWPNDGLAQWDWRRRVLARMQRLAGRAERLGVTLLHENCAGWAGARGDRALALLAAANSPALRLCFDTGNGLEYGYHAPDLLAELLPWVAHVHVKDAVTGPEGVRYVLPGEGRAGVRECLRRLREHGYTGALALEPHLATRPHEGRWSGSPAGFAAAGARLAELVGELSAVAR